MELSALLLSRIQFAFTVSFLDAHGAQYPAEHNVGHLYEAKLSLTSHYKTLDRCNSFNPGIGRSSKCAHWR